ncbi:MAG: retroviral-like aspartic protease family protein [Chloroflexi bacterium]|nr:retroviral-like aspartic protease family protein [Chloroflexota bacterium]MCI0647021.1 retroviral-like aspartic protease family protein [Chloroflexota bacterium]MCI0730721.1 retroviral-like aspartic protease family protein [Chloroflexota bacterium]
MKYPYNQDYFPPAPSVPVRFGRPGESLAIGPLNAFIDTGADATIVPVRFIAPLGLQVDARKYLRSQWGERRKVYTYFVDLEIAESRLPMIEIIADERGGEIILGRNVLNNLIMTLNGPKQMVDIRL